MISSFAHMNHCLLLTCPQRLTQNITLLSVIGSHFNQKLFYVTQINSGDDGSTSQIMTKTHKNVGHQKNRNQKTYFEYLYGRSVCQIVLEMSKRPIFKLIANENLISPDLQDQRISKILHKAAERNIPIEYRSNFYLFNLSNGRPHQGVCLKVGHFIPLTISNKLLHEFISEPVSKPLPLWVFLDSLKDPMNVGAILRTCYFLGIDKIILSRYCSPITAIVNKASSGAAELLPIYTVEKTADFFEVLKDSKWDIIGTDALDEREETDDSISSASSNSVDVTCASMSKPTVLVLVFSNKLQYPNSKLFMENIKVFVSEDPSLFDAKIEIQIKGLNPQRNFTLHSRTFSGNDCFECFSLYKSDNQGLIDLTSHISYGGSYTGIEPMGLFWTLQLSSKHKIYKRLVKRDVTIPLVVTITLFENWLVSLHDISQRSSAEKLKSFQITRLFMAPGVRRIEVNKNGLIGTLFLPPGKGSFPGLITLFGVSGKILEYKPALFASHGFAALALPYFGVKGLPVSIFNIDMEYFEKAIHFLQNHHAIDALNGVGVVAISKGVQVALAMADCLAGIKCVVAINGPCMAAHNSHQYKDQKWNPLFNDTSFKDKVVWTERQSCISRYAFPFNFDDPVHQASLFDFYKRRNIAYMYIAGLNDDAMPSELFANIVERLLKSENHPNYQILRYPGAGHSIEPPYSPLISESLLLVWELVLCHGGVSVPHCRAQEDAWNKQLIFLRDNLCCHKSLKAKH